MATPREINNALLAAQSAEACTAVLKLHSLQTFNDVNLATLLSRLARWRRPETSAAAFRRAAAVLTAARRCNGRTLTSISHSLGVLASEAEKEACGVLLAALVVAVPRLAQAEDAAAPGALATALWTLGSVIAACDLAVPPGVPALCAAAALSSARMSAAELSNAAWGAAKAGVRHAQLFNALAVSCTAAAADGSFTSQGLSNVAWSFSKLGVVAEPLFAALSAAAATLLRAGGFKNDARGLATLAWAFQSRGLPQPELLDALCAAVPPALASLPPQSLASLLQTFSKWQLDAGEAPPPALSHTLSLLGAAALTNLSSASGQDVGLLSAALARGTIAVDPAHAEAHTEALANRVVAVASAMDWRGCAAAELALARHPPSDRRLHRSALRALAGRAAEAAAAVARASEAASACAAAAGLESVRATGPSELGKRVLLVGDDPDGKLSLALKGRGCVVTRWRRDARAGEEGALAWPPATVHDAALLRLPSSSEGAALAVRACAARLRTNSPLLVYGRVDEGCSLSAVRELVGKLFKSVTAVCTPADGAALSLRCVRTDVKAPPLDASARILLPPLQLPGCELPTPPWVVHGGLFAGGGLDVMTAALIAHLALLPTLPPGSRVCDFGAGSGTIAWAMRAREPSLRLSLVDSDALALEAARENVPDARLVLSDGWGSVSSKRKFQAIVSNPPVHAGASDDFTVLIDLLRGAPARLLPEGVLYVVAQAQVPVGRLAAGCRLRARATALEGGRFVAWACKAKTSDC